MKRVLIPFNLNTSEMEMDARFISGITYYCGSVEHVNIG